MELQALHTFKTVAQEGGILAASRKLNTVQSNVTARIKRLESELEVQLFHRQGRGITLSAAGRLLLEYSEKMLGLERQLVSAVRQTGESYGELRLGVMESFAGTYLPSVLKEFQPKHPGLNLKIDSATSGELLRLLISHQLDLVFVAGPIDHPDLISQTLIDERLALVHKRGESWKKLPFILFREGCAYRERALEWRRENGDPTPEIMELGTLDGILGCVAVGLGCTLLPMSVVKASKFSGELEIIEVEDHIANTPTVMVRHRDALPLTAFENLRESVLHISEQC
ncbi:LysR family transcriptional regulator [Dongshaea marina]|uniref:LysR family transcriptional regulator n=1 Tax=Dongshaea marina TaxID=2047966 RepID=UPI000D3EC59D|nr:LysR family transcriptional regulator [Dongshaea marina]